MEVYSSSYRLGAGLVTVIGSTRRVGSWLEMEVYSSSYRLGAGPVTVTQGALEELETVHNSSQVSLMDRLQW